MFKYSHIKTVTFPRTVFRVASEWGFFSVLSAMCTSFRANLVSIYLQESWQSGPAGRGRGIEGRRGGGDQNLLVMDRRKLEDGGASSWMLGLSQFSSIQGQRVRDSSSPNADGYTVMVLFCCHRMQIPEVAFFSSIVLTRQSMWNPNHLLREHLSSFSFLIFLE